MAHNDQDYGSRGPCLIARGGSNLPNCHEYDFCQCDVDEARAAGIKEGMERAAAICDQHSETMVKILGPGEHVGQLLSDDCARTIRMAAQTAKEGVK